MRYVNLLWRFLLFRSGFFNCSWRSWCSISVLRSQQSSYMKPGFRSQLYHSVGSNRVGLVGINPDEAVPWMYKSSVCWGIVNNEELSVIFYFKNSMMTAHFGIGYSERLITLGSYNYLIAHISRSKSSLRSGEYNLANNESIMSYRYINFRSSTIYIKKRKPGYVPIASFKGFLWNLREVVFHKV